MSGVLGSIPGRQHTFVSPSAFSRRAVVSYWRKYVHEVLVNRLGDLSLPRKSVVRLTDRPDMTLDVYRGRKTTKQQQQQFLHNSCVWTCTVSSRGLGKCFIIKITIISTIYICQMTFLGKCYYSRTSVARTPRRFRTRS